MANLTANNTGEVTLCRRPLTAGTQSRALLAQFDCTVLRVLPIGLVALFCIEDVMPSRAQRSR